MNDDVLSQKHCVKTFVGVFLFLISTNIQHHQQGRFCGERFSARMVLMFQFLTFYGVYEFMNEFNLSK